MARSSSRISIEGSVGRRRVDRPERGPPDADLALPGPPDEEGDRRLHLVRRQPSEQVGQAARPWPDRARVDATASDVRTTSASSIRPRYGAARQVRPGFMHP